jgi:hypothetical protein
VNVNPEQSAIPAAQTQRRNQTTLNVQSDAFSHATVRGLIDDWLIPTVINQLLEELLDD